jgi:hypothetical protein
MELVPIFFKLLFVSLIIIVIWLYARLFKTDISFYKFYQENFYKNSLQRFVDAIYKTMFLKTLYIKIVNTLYFVSYKWSLELIDRGLLEKVGSAGLVEGIYKIALKISYVHSQNSVLVFVSSLFNFWIFTYLAILLYLKTVTMSTAATGVINILLVCGIMHYCELIWELINNKASIKNEDGVTKKEKR